MTETLAINGENLEMIQEELLNFKAGLQEKLHYGIGSETNMYNLTSAINANLAQLNLIQNQLNLYNNVNQETLLKQQQLLKMENDTLTKQLRDLEIIQSTLINKDRMIQVTEQNMINQQNNIYLLILCAFLGLVVMLVVFLHGYKIIKPKIFKILIIAIIVIYVIIFIYYYNIFYFKTALSYLTDRRLQRINATLQNWKSVKDANRQEAKYGDKDQWIENNCVCPPPAEEEYAQDKNSGETIVQPKSGYYYYDGTAPQQLLVPTPNINNSTNFKEQIIWPDYSASGQKNYYNAINPNNIENIIRKDLNEKKYSALVGNRTFTNSL